MSQSPESSGSRESGPSSGQAESVRILPEWLQKILPKWVQKTSHYACLPFRWCFGCDLAINDEETKSEVTSLVAVFLFVVGQLGLALVTEHRKDVRPGFLLMYGLAGLMTVSVLVCLNRVRKTWQERKMYRYDRGTKLLAQWILGLCVFTVLGILVLGSKNWLPGQKSVPIRLHNIEVKELADTGFPGLVLYAQFGNQQFPDGVPERFDLLIDLEESVRNEWQLNVAKVFVVTPSGEIVEAAERFAEARPDRTPVEVALAGLRAEQDYLVAMQLIPGTDEAIRESDNFHDMPEGPEKTKAQEKLTAKFQRMAENTRKVLFKKGSLTLSRRI